jgi:hypothetical protein
VHFPACGNKLLWLQVLVVMLRISDYARLSVHALDKERTSAGRFRIRNL